MVISVLSGKGGTGKTTVVAALSELASDIVRADCDVDAPNLYLFYKGTDLEKSDFFGGRKAEVNQNLCTCCGMCETVCKFDAIHAGEVDLLNCEGCGACIICCPQHAITWMDEKSAEVYITQTEKGILSRAVMEVGSDGSGKLVTHLRKNAKRFETEQSITILDGSPGIGCAVIASITDTDMVLIVTEPTKSGLDDLKRILELAARFDTQILLCINKYDINPEISAQIEKYAEERKLSIVGRIPFDEKVMESVNTLRPITEFKDSMAGKAIKEMWLQMKIMIDELEMSKAADKCK